MISIFNDLKDNNSINFDINDYIDQYTEIYLNMNKDYEYYYKIYNDIKDLSIDILLKNELNDLIKNKPPLYDFKSRINSYFLQAVLKKSFLNFSIKDLQYEIENN